MTRDSWPEHWDAEMCRIADARDELRAALAEARRERDEARAALAMFTHAPNGEAICACRNREAVKAGVARPCAACIARSIIAAAPDGSRDE